MTTRSIRTRLATVGAVACSLTLAACGSDSLSGQSTSAGAAAPSASVTQTADSKLADMVPASIKSKGTLTVGSDASYAPNEYLAANGSTVIGMDVDLLTSALDKLGLKATFQNGGFDALIAGTTAGKYDAAISSFTINAERLKSVTMVSYLSAGTSWATLKGNPKKVDPSNPCGLTVGVQKGTTQLDELTALNKAKCKAKPVNLVVEQLQSKVTTDLVAGKVDAMAADSPVALYAVKQTGDKLQSVGDITASAPYGVVLPKAETDFAKALAAAFKAMAADGSYKQILDKWGQASGAIDTFAVNPTPAS